MAAKGQPKSGGRKPGTPNKKSLDVRAIAERLGCDPFEILIYMAKGDWKSLGYEKKDRLTSVSQAGDVYEDQVTPEMRLKAASEASQYLYPKRKAIEHTHEIDQGLIEEAEKLAAMDESQIIEEIGKELKLVKGSMA